MYRQILIACALITHQGIFAQPGIATQPGITEPKDITKPKDIPIPTAIAQRTFDFRDSSRHRPVITEVWYPTTDTLQTSDKTFSAFTRNATVRNGSFPTGKLPLIMLSHGTGGGRLTLEWLAQALAEQGYIVAAVDHYGNTFDNKIPMEFLKPWERPLDISFALTALLNDKGIAQSIDPQKIGAIGFSFGGFTVLALAGGEVDYITLLNYYETAGHKEIDIPELPGLPQYLKDSSASLKKALKDLPPLKDARISAVFSISPALGPGFTTKRQFKNLTTPVYITGSQSDSIAPVRTNAHHFHELIKNSGYYEFPGRTGHYVMLGEAIDEVKKSYGTYFADAPGVDRHEVHRKVDELAVSFFKENL
jgi:predicted dienelactone hydrolase